MKISEPLELRELDARIAPSHMAPTMWSELVKGIDVKFDDPVHNSIAPSFHEAVVMKQRLTFEQAFSNNDLFT